MPPGPERINALRHALRQSHYKPDFGDWCWYGRDSLSPPTQLLLANRSHALRSHAEPLLFLVAGIALVLLYTGIHNAWDTVTYIIVATKSKDKESN